MTRCNMVMQSLTDIPIVAAGKQTLSMIRSDLPVQFYANEEGASYLEVDQPWG